MLIIFLLSSSLMLSHPKLNLLDRISVRQFEAVGPKACILPLQDGSFVLVMPDRNEQVRLSKNGDSLERIPGISNYHLLRLERLDDGGFLAIHKASMGWDMVVRKRDASFKVFEEHEFTLEMDDLVHFAVQVSRTGKHLVSLRAGLFSPDRPEREVYNVLLNTELEPVKKLFSHTEGGRLYANPSLESLETLLRERVRGFLAVKHVMGFDQLGNLVLVNVATKTLQRIDPNSGKVITAVELDMGAERSPPPISYLVRMYADVIQKSNPKTGELMKSAWLAEVSAGLKKDSPPPAPVLVWGVLPMGEQHIGLVTGYDLETGSQRCRIYTLNGKPIGELKSRKPIFLTEDFLPRMVFFNHKAYSLEVNDEGKTEIMTYQLSL